MAKDIQTIVSEFNDHIQKQGGQSSAWYVGVTKAIDQCHLQGITMFHGGITSSSIVKHSPPMTLMPWKRLFWIGAVMAAPAEEVTTHVSCTRILRPLNRSIEVQNKALHSDAANRARERNR